MSESKTASQLGKGLVYVSLLFSLVALVIVGVTAWQGWHHGKQRQAQQVKQGNTLLALESSVASIEAQQKQLSASLKDIQQLASWQNRDWVLSEVHYLLDLANLNLQFQHNIPATIQLLVAADHRLQLVKDPSLLPLRKAIATDKQRLQSATVVDVSGLLMKIQVLSDAVSQLPLLPSSATITTPTVTPAPEKTDAVSEGWRSALQKTGEQLRGLVIIEKQTTLSKGALVPIQHAYNNLYVQTLLAQLQWAVLQGNDSFYQSTIQNVQTYVANHYLQHSQSMMALQKNLADLRAVHLNPEYPDVNGTLTALKAVMHSGSTQHD